MPIIEIKAIDTLFFRDGKPFDMGEDAWAEGLFPPPPSVFRGALRSAYFAENPNKIQLANTEQDPTKDIKITKIFIKKGDTIYTPFPLDYVYKKDEVINGNLEDVPFFHLKLIDNNNSEIFSNTPLPYIPFSDGIVESSKNFLLDKIDFEDYYRNNIIDERLFGVILEKTFQIEPKIGVGLNNFTRSPEERKLFRVGLNRLNQEFEEDEGEFIKETSFVVEYDFDFIPKILKFGAENKTAIVNKIPFDPASSFDEENLSSHFFKIALLQPAVFNNGWKPDIQKLMPGIEVKLISAFVGKPLSIGGWDMASKKPKTMYKAVPAGSVFYYEIKNGKTLAEVNSVLSNIDFLSEVENGMGTFEIAALKLENLMIK